MTEHIIIDDPDAGEVHVWADRSLNYVASASRHAVFTSSCRAGGAIMKLGEPTSECTSSCLGCLAIRTHRALAKGAR